MMESYPSINIVGAGIAGLSLACHLRRRRIPFNIFDGAPGSKGHNYGISLSPWSYQDLAGNLVPKVDAQMFRDVTAVDRLIGGEGMTEASDKQRDDLRALDISLRKVLAGGHQVNWDHKVISAERVSDGLKLKFENGMDSTARLTVDAGGERSGLTSLHLPDLKPEILPYAVYHGSRYVSQSVFEHHYGDIFRGGENVRSFPAPASMQPSPSSSSPPPPLSSTWHLQVAKSYITRDQIPSAAKLEGFSRPNEPIVEFRYTFSRSATNTTRGGQTIRAEEQYQRQEKNHSTSMNTAPDDPLFNPYRSKDGASETPNAFFDEITTYLSTNTEKNALHALPRSLTTLLLSSSSQSAANFTTTTTTTIHSIRQDRILNWLLRLRSPELFERNRGGRHPHLEFLASRHIVAIGDSIHATPPLSSEGAGAAMVDAAKLAAWIQDVFCHRHRHPHREKSGNGGDGQEEEGEEVPDRMDTYTDVDAIIAFYDERLMEWSKLMRDARERLERMHSQSALSWRGKEMDKMSEKLHGRM